MIFQPYTKTVENEEYIKTLISVLDEINNIIKSETSVYTIENKTFVTERLSTSLRHVVQSGSPLARIIKGQILDSAYKAEKAGADSTKLFLTFISTLLNKLILEIKSEKSIPQIISRLDKEYEEIKEQIKDNIVQPKWDDIVECVNRSSRNKIISDMVLEAVNLAGLEGNIIPGGSANGKYSVELVSGYNFPVSTYPLFTEEDNGRWGRGDVRVLVVDGVIERASEMTKIFTEAYENGKPHLVVARGYGEEVIATISANPKIDMCPIRIPWELDSINFIADISIVCGSQIVSSMKGDTIGKVDYKSIPIVDKVICTNGNLNIINDKTRNVVSAHLSDLNKRRDEINVEEMSEFVNRRIKALNSHTVHIRLGSLTEQQKMKELESADFSLRIVKGILDKGTVHFRELGFNHKMPTISILSAIYHGISLAKSLISVDLAIMND